VFEHILNNPVGLLQSIHRILRPSGLLLLDTPNPSTLANALRVLGDGYVLWGTHEFLRQPKVDGGRVIDRGDIHYREYPAWLVRELLQEVGFNCAAPRYIPSGITATSSRGKRALKRIVNASGLGRTRLFGYCYVLAARKPGANPAGADG
jgi:hypothetical protein